MAETERINFTKKSLSAIQPASAGKRLRIYDTQTKGLLIDVTSTGSKTFYCRRKINGVSNWHRIGPYPDISIEQARGLAAAINSEVAKGTNPGDRRKLLRQEPTLEEMFEEYIERHAKKSRKTWEAMQKDFQRNLNNWKARKLSSITHADVEKLHTDLGKERGHYTANRTVQLLRAIFNKGKVWKLFQGDNPAANISMFIEKPRDRFLSTEEANRLLAAVELEKPETRDLIKLALFTGARKSNLLAMRFDQLDLERGIWSIPETKNGSAQIIHLTPNEIELLKERRTTVKGDFVFPGEGKSQHLMDPKRSWTALRKRAGLEDITMHDLRRSLAASMASANISLVLVKNVLNHKDQKTTLAVYARTGKDAERDARMTAHQLWKSAGKGADKQNGTD